MAESTTTEIPRTQNQPVNVVSEAEGIVAQHTPGPLAAEDGPLLADMIDKRAKAKEGFQTLSESARAVSEAERVVQEHTVTHNSDQTVTGKNPLLDVPDNDPRKPYTAKYSHFPVNDAKDQQTLLDQITRDYIAELTSNQHVTKITVDEANKAYTDLALEKARQQQLVNQLNEKGEPIPPEITLDADGKVKIDAAKTAGDSIKAPRILQRIEELKKEGLAPFLQNDADTTVINEALARDPSTSYLEIRKKIDDRRTTENHEAIANALKGFHVPFNEEEKMMLTSIVNDYRNNNGSVDEKVYSSIKRSAVERKVIGRINELSQNRNTLFYYPSDKETIDKIVESVLAGKEPEEMIQKMKISKNPTFGSTIGQMIKEIFKKIGQSAAE